MTDTTQRTAQSVTVPRPPGHRRRLVVVGNGMAGIRAVVRRSSNAAARGPSTSPSSATNRTGTTTGSCCPTCCPGRRAEEGIVLNPLSWYEENGIDLRAGVRVDHVDHAARVVHDAAGGRTPYDTLPIATAPRPFFPPMEGCTAVTVPCSRGCSRSARSTTPGRC